MNVGTYLVGAAILLLVAAFVGSPLRHSKVDTDKAIEQWVANARVKIKDDISVSADEQTLVLPVVEITTGEPVNFCPQCGRRVEVDHRFCPGCGKELMKGASS
jgi:rRNA maturation endonuclease Nob1